MFCHATECCHFCILRWVKSMTDLAIDHSSWVIPYKVMLLVQICLFYCNNKMLCSDQFTNLFTNLLIFPSYKPLLDGCCGSPSLYSSLVQVHQFRRLLNVGKQRCRDCYSIEKLATYGIKIILNGFLLVIFILGSDPQLDMVCILKECF